jgi:hypothetical protein
MEKQLIEESPDGVATLTFNRPDRLNALLTINSGRRVRGALVCGRLAEFVLAQLKRLPHQWLIKRFDGT